MIWHQDSNLDQGQYNSWTSNEQGIVLQNDDGESSFECNRRVCPKNREQPNFNLNTLNQKFFLWDFQFFISMMNQNGNHN